MYTKEQLAKIFERIGLVYREDAPVDAALVRDIQYGCQSRIPYENLDIIRRRPLSLDYGDLYDKIVNRHMGGYCFEINGFLGEVYRSLGCSVTDYMARYLRGETEIPVRRHRVLGVTVDGRRYICDAGIGQSAFRHPLLMEEGSVSEQFGETYKVTKEPFLGWVISDLHHGEWRKFYSFTEEEQLNIDYIMPSFWCEHSPESPFNKDEMFAIKTDTGRITLDGSTLKIFDGENVTVREVAPCEKAEVYRTYFGLEAEEGDIPACSHGDRAAELFLSGYNCAQAVFGAFCDVTGLEFEEAMKMASSFGGGMGRMREVCGAVSAMFLAAGILYGYGDTGEDGAKAEHYKRIQAMAEEFRSQHGTIVCRELIASLKKDASPVPEARTEKYYKERPCAAFVRTAAECLDRLIRENR